VAILPVLSTSARRSLDVWSKDATGVFDALVAYVGLPARPQAWCWTSYVRPLGVLVAAVPALPALQSVEGAPAGRPGTGQVTGHIGDFGSGRVAPCA
jgi:hypothetical protein